MPTGAVTPVRIAYHCNDKADHVDYNQNQPTKMCQDQLTKPG